jgi:phytol kinase
MNNLLGIGLSYVLVFLIIGISTLLQKTKVLNDEGARKFIHIGVSNWWILAMIFFDNIWLASIAPVTFIGLNYASYKMNLIKAMERGGKGNLGTVYFPISLLILVLFTFAINQPFIGAIGILILGYGDGLAAVVGTKYGKVKLRNGKSLEGTFTMFVSSFIVAIVLLTMYAPSVFYLAIIVAIAATLIELYTPKGLDNLTVPLGTSLLTYILLIILSII